MAKETKINLKVETSANTSGLETATRKARALQRGIGDLGKAHQKVATRVAQVGASYGRVNIPGSDKEATEQVRREQRREAENRVALAQQKAYDKRLEIGAEIAEKRRIAEGAARRKYIVQPTDEAARQKQKVAKRIELSNIRKEFNREFFERTKKVHDTLVEYEQQMAVVGSSQLGTFVQGMGTPGPSRATPEQLKKGVDLASRIERDVARNQYRLESRTARQISRVQGLSADVIGTKERNRIVKSLKNIALSVEGASAHIKEELKKTEPGSARQQAILEGYKQYVQDREEDLQELDKPVRAATQDVSRDRRIAQDERKRLALNNQIKTVKAKINETEQQTRQLIDNSKLSVERKAALYKGLDRTVAGMNARLEKSKDSLQKLQTLEKDIGHRKKESFANIRRENQEIKKRLQLERDSQKLLAERTRKSTQIARLQHRTRDLRARVGEAGLAPEQQKELQREISRIRTDAARRLRGGAGPLSWGQQTRTDAAIARVNRTLSRYKREARGAVSATSDLGRMLRNMESASVLAIGPLSGLGARIRSLGAISTRATAALALGFGTVIGTLAATVIAYRRAITAGLEYERVAGALNVVTKSATLTNLLFEDLSRTAITFGINIEASTFQFSKLAAASKGTAVGMKTLKDVYEGVSAAVATFRIDAQGQEKIFRALTQMLSKGKAQAEEVRNQFAEHLPGAFNTMARALGITTDEFSRRLERGLIASEDLIAAIGKTFKEEYGESGRQATKALGVQLNILRNNWFQFGLELDRTTGASHRMYTAVKTLNEGLADLSKNTQPLVDIATLGLAAVGGAAAFGGHRLVRAIYRHSTGGKDSIAQRTAAGATQAFRAAEGNKFTRALKATIPAMVAMTGGVWGLVTVLTVAAGTIAAYFTARSLTRAEVAVRPTQQARAAIQRVGEVDFKATGPDAFGLQEDAKTRLRIATKGVRDRLDIIRSLEKDIREFIKRPGANVEARKGARHGKSSTFGRLKGELAPRLEAAGLEVPGSMNDLRDILVKLSYQGQQFELDLKALNQTFKNVTEEQEANFWRLGQQTQKLFTTMIEYEARTKDAAYASQVFLDFARKLETPVRDLDKVHAVIKGFYEGLDQVRTTDEIHKFIDRLITDTPQKFAALQRVTAGMPQAEHPDSPHPGIMTSMAAILADYKRFRGVPEELGLTPDSLKRVLIDLGFKDAFDNLAALELADKVKRAELTRDEFKYSQEGRRALATGTVDEGRKAAITYDEEMRKLFDSLLKEYPPGVAIQRYFSEIETRRIEGLGNLSRENQKFTKSVEESAEAIEKIGMTQYTRLGIEGIKSANKAVDDHLKRVKAGIKAAGHEKEVQDDLIKLAEAKAQIHRRVLLDQAELSRIRQGEARVGTQEEYLAEQRAQRAVARAKMTLDTEGRVASANKQRIDEEKRLRDATADALGDREAAIRATDRARTLEAQGLAELSSRHELFIKNLKESNLEQYKNKYILQDMIPLLEELGARYGVAADAVNNYVEALKKDTAEVGLQALDDRVSAFKDSFDKPTRLDQFKREMIAVGKLFGNTNKEVWSKIAEGRRALQQQGIKLVQEDYPKMLQALQTMRDETAVAGAPEHLRGELQIELQVNKVLADRMKYLDEQARLNTWDTEQLKEQKRLARDIAQYEKQIRKEDAKERKRISEMVQVGSRADQFASDITQISVTEELNKRGLKAIKTAIETFMEGTIYEMQNAIFKATITNPLKAFIRGFMDSIIRDFQNVISTTSINKFGSDLGSALVSAGKQFFGIESSAIRGSVSPAAATAAPRAPLLSHRGSVVGRSLSSRERPAILTRDQSVLTPSQLREVMRMSAGLGGGGKVTINDYRSEGEDVQVRQEDDGSTTIDIYSALDDMMAQTAAKSGNFQETLLGITGSSRRVLMR